MSVNLLNTYSRILKPEIIKKKQEYVTENLVDIRKFENKVEIASNNNMNLLANFTTASVEADKYFNYYKPEINKRVSQITLMNESISTVEALDKKYDIEDGYL
jgi:hypothetical protein